MRTYTVTLSEITIDTIDAYLEQLWQEYHAKPQEIHLAAKDHLTLAVSVASHDIRIRPYASGLCINPLDIGAILSPITGQMVKLIKEVGQERGVILFHEEEQERVGDMQLVSYAELG